MAISPIGDNVLNQAVQLVAITPSDATALTPTRALFIGNNGTAVSNVAVQCVNDSAAVTFTNVQPGTILPICVIKVMATGTTATNIVALY